MRRGPNLASLDREVLTRCIAVAVGSESERISHGVAICRAGKVVAESINRVAHEHDVTRHAEVVATTSPSAEGIRCGEPRRLRDLRERGAVRLLLLRYPGEPDGPRGLCTGLAAHGRRLEMERADQRGPFQDDAVGVRPAAQDYRKGLRSTRALLELNPLV